MLQHIYSDNFYNVGICGNIFPGADSKYEMFPELRVEPFSESPLSMMFDGRVAEPHGNEKCTLGLRARDQYANKFILLGARAHIESERERGMLLILAGLRSNIYTMHYGSACWMCSRIVVILLIPAATQQKALPDHKAFCIINNESEERRRIMLCASAGVQVFNIASLLCCVH